MKAKKLLAIIAPAMLLASCGGNKNTTTISKIDLTNAKTLIMGKLSNSSVTTNDEEEQLISVDEEGNATETEVEVTTGDKTTETTNITISRLVKLNKEYAIVSCTYNDVTYDLIVNLADGKCVKFPDSSLLPNSKEKLGGHKKYRKYKKQFGYLNNSIVQPNEETNIFYYINHYQCDASDTTTYARRLVVLDLTGDSPSAKAIVTPAEKHSVQSFAVDSKGNVIYVASDTEKIDDDTVFDSPKLHYDDNKEDVDVTIKEGLSYDSISNYLIPGNDGLIYCYLVKDSKYYVASITINTDVDPATAIASPVESSTPTEVDEPDKVFTIKNDNSVNIVSINKNIGNKINQLLSFGITNSLFNNRAELNIEKPGPKPGPSPWGRKDDVKPSKDKTIDDTSGQSLTLYNIEDGYSGNSYSYLFGSLKSGGKKGLRKVQLKTDNSSYEYIESILNDYFLNASEDADVAELEVDEDTDDITVVVEDGDTETVVVVDEDAAAGEEETVVNNVTDVSDVVDVND